MRVSYGQVQANELKGNQQWVKRVHPNRQGSESGGHQ